jgi:hypothetical protein
MGTERAAALIGLEVEARDLRVVKGEVVVAGSICAKSRVIMKRSEIDRSTLS